MHCDHTMHFSADLSLWLDNPMFWAPCPPILPAVFPHYTWKRDEALACKVGKALKENNDKYVVRT